MSVMSIRIDDSYKKKLKILSSIEGKTMGNIVAEMIKDYINANKDKLLNANLSNEDKYLMALSAQSFSEWDNEEDEIYNDL